MSRGTISAVAVAVGLVCLNLSGCMLIAGGTDETRRPNTLGQELRDLKAARDDGAVNDEEYDSARHKLLASHDRR
jgi:hypothetical protein